MPLVRVVLYVNGGKKILGKGGNGGNRGQNGNVGNGQNGQTAFRWNTIH